MKIALTTPNGHIGRQLAELLLANPMDHDIIILPHHRRTVIDFEDRGAEIREVDLTKRDQVLEVTEDIDTLFWVIPENIHTDDLIGHMRKVGGNGADAVRLNNIGRAIFISSLGGHQGEAGRHGPVKAFKFIEEMFRFVTKNLIIVRPTYFMENLLGNLTSIAAEGKIYLPVPGESSIFMIATRDIAAAIAGVIRTPFTGSRIMPLHGPREYSFNDVAETFGQALGKSITYVQVPIEAASQALIASGLSSNVAGEYLELLDAIAARRIVPEHPHSADAATPTTLEEFARTVVLPLMQSRKDTPSSKR